MCHVVPIEEIYPGPVVESHAHRGGAAHVSIQVHMNVRVFIAL